MHLKSIVTSLAMGGLLFVGAQTASASEQHNGSIVDYLKINGQDSSFSHRSEIAKVNGISNYSGNAIQNVRLLNILEGSHPVATTPKAAPQQTQQAAAQNPVSQPKSQSRQGRTLTVTATAYTAYCSGCSGKTATGIDLRANPNQKVIAVDPNVIPLGSRVYVEGYGEAVAGDTGGAIGGSKIDVFFPNKQTALNWGVRTINITVLD